MFDDAEGQLIYKLTSSIKSAQVVLEIVITEGQIKALFTKLFCDTVVN